MYGIDRFTCVGRITTARKKTELLSGKKYAAGDSDKSRLSQGDLGSTKLSESSIKYDGLSGSYYCQQPEPSPIKIREKEKGYISNLNRLYDEIMAMGRVEYELKTSLIS